MVVDSHHHLWDPAKRDYPWMVGDALAPIRRRFDAVDLKPLLDSSGIDRTVVVQTVSSLSETREFLQAAAENDFIAGVVGWVDLTNRAVAKTLSELKRRKGGSFLVGIRHQVHDEPDPEWLLREDVQRGIAEVGEAGLVYDLLVRTRELPSGLETIKRHPGMRFVIDHAAKPRIAAGVWDLAWEKALAPAADYPNVTCKLSGLVTEAEWTAWTAEQLEPYVNKVLEWFGPERCLFGSDWPVCLLASGYARTVGVVMDDLAARPPAARAAVLGGTAARFWNLDQGETSP